MNFIKNFSGILACFCVVIASLLCAVVAPDVITEQNYVLSYFGKEPSTQFIFNLSLVCAGLLLLIFLNEVVKKLRSNYHPLIFLLPGCFFSLVGVVSLKVNEFLHTTFFISFIASWFWVMIITARLVRTKKHALLLTSSTIIAIVLLTILFLADVSLWIWAEFVLGCFVLFHVMLLTDYLIFYKEKKNFLSKIIDRK